ncbi:MAG: hypothetical protein BAA00_06070 [Parageobacillus thermoglucosidasius]|jgi:hypothetical protein|nr:MAG: hypothetical protein BAA00_06070 [Parageobacillus thermoglucosidasius]
MNTEDYYNLKSSLQGLKMLKLAYDYGINIRNFPDFNADISFYSAEWDIFIECLQSLFTIVDWWTPYEGEDEEKIYWLQQANIDTEAYGDVDGTGVIVLLDDRFTRDSVSDEACYSVGPDRFLYYGYAEILPIENGLLIYYCEDDGEIDLVEVLYILIDCIKNVRGRRKQ